MARLFLFHLFLSTSFILNAQFVVENANEVRVMYRSIEELSDSTFIHVYHSANQMKLKGKSLDGLQAEFNWYAFDLSNKQINTIPIKTESGVNSILPVTGENGYMLTVKQNQRVDSFYTWTIIDTFSIKTIRFENSCESLRLFLTANHRLNYVYIDFSIPEKAAEERIIPNKFRVEWSSNVDIRDGLDKSDAWEKTYLSLSTLIDNPAPLLDATYTAKLISEFNFEASKTSELIPFKAVYAAFEVLRPNDDGKYESTTDINGEALYRVKFRNTSKNADEFLWNGKGNQKINFERDKIIWTAKTKDIDEEKIYKPGQYPVQLTVQNSRTTCKSNSYILDKSGKEVDILVAPSKFNPASLPNIFTPNGDNKNDVFYFVDQQVPVSLNEISIKIFGRGGKQVYEYEGDVHAWKGWDGKLKGNGSDCSEGVYYYVISASAWDDVDYKGKQYTGNLHLFRGN